MIKITKYINVKLRLDKIIRVEEENIERAKEMASEIFYDNELTAEYLNARDVEFSENKEIDSYADLMAKVIVENYGNDITIEEVKEHISDTLRNNEFVDYVFEETIRKLEVDYSIDLGSPNKGVY